MEDMGDVPFRTGGSRGAWKLSFGEWAELGEDLLNLDVFPLPELWQGSALRGQ